MNLDELINNAMNDVLAKDLLNTAVENDNAKRLIQYSQDDEYRQYFNTQKLLEIAANKDSLKVIAAIIENQGTIESPNEYGLNKAMNAAASKGNTEAVKLIGTKLSAENFTLSLFYAATEGHAETAETLIDMGANLDVVVNNPLEAACSNGKLEMVHTLIKRGASVDFNADDALKKAVLNGHENIARSLIMEHRATIIDKEFFENWNPQVFEWEKKRELNDKLQTNLNTSKPTVKKSKMKDRGMKI